MDGRARGRRARTLKEHFQVASLTGFGMERMTAAQGAAGAVLEYLKETQLTSLGHVTRIERHDPEGVLVLGSTTRRRLDLVQAHGRQPRHDAGLGARPHARPRWAAACCATGSSRRWRTRRPSSAGTTASRSSSRTPSCGATCATCSATIRDVERILARVAVNRANARDLASLGQSLEALPPLKALLADVYTRTLGDLRERVLCFEDLADVLARAIADEPPVSITEGGMIREGFDEQLDELRGLSRNAKEWIAAYQAQEAERTGITSLKVGFNKVFGYYIEVTHKHRDKVPEAYKRKQTLANAERYVTPKLDEYEQKVLTADEKARDLEHRLFTRLRDQTAESIPGLQGTAAVLAELDAIASLAEVASANDYVRPEMLEDRTLELRDARHPVVESALEGGDRFVPNDTELDADRRIALITGPNMAGKSTYIRQTAIVVLMAQMGSFVPASKARIGICDRLFTRVGAEDDLARRATNRAVVQSAIAILMLDYLVTSLILGEGFF